jgi:hypothetical protein
MELVSIKRLLQVVTPTPTRSELKHFRRFTKPRKFCGSLTLWHPSKTPTSWLLPPLPLSKRSQLHYNNNPYNQAPQHSSLCHSLGRKSWPPGSSTWRLMWTDQHIRYIAAMLLPN